MKELKLLFDSRRLPTLHERDLGHWTNLIYYNVGTGGKKKTSRRLIFGTLVLLGRSEWIFDFIKAGLYDKDLPLPCRQPVGPRAENSLNGESKPPHKHDFMQAWTWRQQKEFNDVQWQFLAPYFDMKGEVPFLWLRDETPLPFLVNMKNTKMEIVEGGFGHVFKVQIHHAHHNYECARPVSHSGSEASHTGANLIKFPEFRQCPEILRSQETNQPRRKPRIRGSTTV